MLSCIKFIQGGAEALPPIIAVHSGVSRTKPLGLSLLRWYGDREASIFIVFRK